jgi:hypothetical protein
VPDRAHHRADLTLPPLEQGDLEKRPYSALVQDLRLTPGRPSLVDVDPGTQRSEGGPRDTPLDPDPIRSWNLKRGVQKLVSQSSVVREEEEPFARRIEATHGIETSAARHEVKHRLTSVGISRGRDDPPWLVHEVAPAGRAPREWASVDRDGVARRIGTSPELGHNAAVHLDSPLADPALRLAAGAHTGRGQNLLNPPAR